jgi:hypothetical protein
MTLQGEQGLFVVLPWLGRVWSFQKARVKGMVNWTKVQVPLHVTGRVSNKGPQQYHQTSAMVTVRADLLLISSKDQPSLHLDEYARNSNPPPHIEKQDAVRTLRWRSYQPRQL